MFGTESFYGNYTKAAPNLKSFQHSCKRILPFLLNTFLKELKVLQLLHQCKMVIT